MSNSSLSQTALKGVLWASVEKFGGRLIQFVSTIILARILLPEDFGTIAMIMIIFAVASSLIDSGFSQALIREHKISESDKSTTFFINFTVAIVLIITIWFLAPMVSKFYEKEILTDLVRFMALTPLFFSLTIVQRAHFVHKISSSGIFQLCFILDCESMDS
ncbi:MAG: oligosaccharide flippase family protein [Balneola sp.]|nr:oligosaccharide flippase family protein [Balneola sp.]